MIEPARARTRVKICGIVSAEAAHAAVEAGADAIGVVRASRSPRFVSREDIADILDAVPPFVDAVGVYEAVTAASIDPEELRPWAAVQLHGPHGEDELRCWTRPVIRGFAFDPDELRRWDRCPTVSALLVDGPDAGSGRPFDHATLAGLLSTIRRPVILAGGLTPEIVGAAIRVVRPFAVDVSSGVESAPGVKDPERIRAFCRAVREADS